MLSVGIQRDKRILCSVVKIYISKSFFKKIRCSALLETTKMIIAPVGRIQCVEFNKRNYHWRTIEVLVTPC